MESRSDTSVPDRPAGQVTDGPVVTSWMAEGGFACPRCGRTVDDEYYGPCASCRTTLRLSVTAEAKDVEDVAYEPKMNVTPNAVALKD